MLCGRLACNFPTAYPLPLSKKTRKIENSSTWSRTSTLALSMTMCESITSTNFSCRSCMIHPLTTGLSTTTTWKTASASWRRSAPKILTPSKGAAHLKLLVHSRRQVADPYVSKAQTRKCPPSQWTSASTASARSCKSAMADSLLSATMRASAELWE